MKDFRVISYVKSISEVAAHDLSSAFVAVPFRECLNDWQLPLQIIFNI